MIQHQALLKRAGEAALHHPTLSSVGMTPFELRVVALGGPELLASYLRHLEECRGILEEISQSPCHQKVGMCSSHDCLNGMVLVVAIKVVARYVDSQ